MPPERGRASRACIACRKQKTRCYETANGQACLRCERLGLAQDCSLRGDTSPFHQGLAGAWPGNGNTDKSLEHHDQRIDRLERLVTAFARRLDDVEAAATPAKAIMDARGSPPVVEAPVNRAAGGRLADASAPLFVLRDVTAQSGVRPGERIAAPASTTSRDISDDVILKGLLTEQEGISLLSLFNEHYGRWVSFDRAISAPRLVEDVRKSPLLLAACCLIAVRHTTQELAARLAPKLFQDVRKLLAQSILNVPQPLEFFQAALILSLWSTTIGQVPLNTDSWLLSGFALQHSAASELFLAKQEDRDGQFSREHLDNLCIWNHLCLAHLHYCVGTRRKAVLDYTDVEQCRLILGSDHATNFESRMVAEVHLYWIIYRCCNVTIDLPKTQSALQTWKEEWGYLLEQPRAQFVQMGFFFAQLLAYDQSLKARSAAVRESLLSEMIRLSTSIINLAMDTADDRTQHLTDHIYHMISFAAVTLCRLLHTCEDQLSTTHNLDGLDTLVLSLVSWLHAIGLPCHVAHTMGDVVAAFHKKLRPDAGPSPSVSYAGVDPAIQDDFAQLFPEFYGTSSFDMINGALLSDYNVMA